MESWKSDILHRVYFLYPYFSILNSILLFLQIITVLIFLISFWIFDNFFTLIRNFKNKNNFLFFLTLSSFLACVSFKIQYT